MIHPDTRLQFVAPDLGHGVVASAPIPCGTVTWVLDPLDQVFTDAQLGALPAALRFDRERNTFVLPDGRYVLPWGLSAYVNHHCAPNTLRTAHGFEIAVRDIAAGEQVTNDYANLGMHPQERFDCRCGAAGCRGLVLRSDAARLQRQWEAAIEQALQRAPAVAQPLAALLPQAEQALLHGTLLRTRRQA